MDTKELQAILDGLDRRLALGEIDIGTYQSIKAKFSVQLNDSKSTNPVEAAVSAIPKQARALKCPGCMAPLPPPSEPSQISLTCEYCGGVFALQTATEEMDRLMGNIHKWISEMAGGIGVGTTVDEASRVFIFEDKLFPSLKLAADRATEIFGMTRYQPLFTFSTLAKLSSSSFHQALQSTPDLSYLVDKVKDTVARVQAPEIQVFAVGEKQKARLKSIEVQCLETVHLSNVRHQLSSNTIEGIKKAKTNLHALAELYGTASKLSQSTDQSFSRFSSALASRLEAVEKASDTLGYLVSNPEGVMTDRIVSDLESSAITCEKAASEIEGAGREPKEAVPAADGTRVDAQTMRVLAACVRLFGQCGAETGESFTGFLSSLEQSIDSTKSSTSDLTWLLSFVSNLAKHLEATSGEGSVPVVQDFGWVDGRIISLIRSSLFGGREEAQAEKKMLLPFWAADLEYSQQKGVVFKKGQAIRGLILLEASRNNGVCCVIPPEDPLSASCYQSLKSPGQIGQSASSAVPVMDSQDALKSMKRFISSTPGYAGGYAKMLGLIYLPVAIGKYYTKKAERREVLSPSASISVPAFAAQSFHLGSKEITVLQ